MMTRNGLLDQIRRYFSVLDSDMKQKIAVNRLEDNITGENIAAGLLNLIYGYSFRNANRVSRNHKAIDLLDPDAEGGGGVAAQITASNTRQKVIRTMKSFQEEEKDQRLCDEYAKLIVLILTMDKKFKGWEEISSEEYALTILNLMDLSVEIEDYDPDRLQQILDYLAKELGPLTGNVQAPTHLLPLVPQPAPFFAEGSRDRELDCLTAAVNSRQNIFIWGLGGIGKTQVAIQLALRFQGVRDFYFINYLIPDDPSLESMEETILRARFSGLTYEDTTNPGKRRALFSERLDILQQEYGNAVVIIDSFERPGRVFSGLCQEESFRLLMQTGVQFVFTTRYALPEYPQWEIRALDQKCMLRILKDRCNASEEDLLSLIDITGGHTLTMELISKSLANGNGRIKPGRILRALESGTLDQEEYPLIHREGDERQRRIYAHLIALFKMCVLDEVSRNVMRYASLLPEDGMATEIFAGALSTGVNAGPVKWYQKIFGGKGQQAAVSEADTLNNLAAWGWLTKGSLLTIHPMIRMLCRSELKPGDENCGAFLHRLKSVSQSCEDTDGDPYWALYRCFSNAAQYLEDERGEWKRTAHDMWNRVDPAQRELVFALRMLERQEREKPRDEMAVADCCDHVSALYLKLKKYREVLEYGIRALGIWEQSAGGRPEKLAQLYGRMGEASGAVSRLKDAVDYRLKALAVWQRIRDSSDKTVTDALYEVAVGLRNLGKYQEALEYIDRAISQSGDSDSRFWNVKGLILMRLGKFELALPFLLRTLDAVERKNTLNYASRAAISNNIGACYSQMGNHGQALKYELKAVAIREKILPPDHPKLADSYNNVGTIFGSLGNHRQALEYLLKAVGIYEKVLPLNHPDLATIYNNVGMTYGALGDHQKALEYGLKDMAICEKVLPPDHPDLAASYNNVGVTYGELGDHQKALEYKLKALLIQKKALPSDHPNLVSTYSNVGYAYGRLGNDLKALEFYEKALAIQEEKLPAGHPYTEITKREIANTKLRLAEKEPAAP